MQTARSRSKMAGLTLVGGKVRGQGRALALGLASRGAVPASHSWTTAAHL